MPLTLLFDVFVLHLDNHIFFNGTTRNTLSMIDTRKEGVTSGSLSFKNDAMINSMLVYTISELVLSGQI